MSERGPSGPGAEDAGDLPRPDPANADDAAFWGALREGELRVQQCAACGVYRHPPRSTCAACGSDEHASPPVSGAGEVWSFTVVHPPTLRAFADRTPYGAVVVRLDVGVFLVSNLVDTAVDELAVGARVELVLTAVDDDLVLPLFRVVG